ncbi:MAG TPA: bi-domain-containing oxidoreductase, partial [Candidatus Sulfotelmatobacter sp.]|nr:bi-domain-containing oxidoreductase [Candidatus Sulfotelmatobacter sp.]
MRQLFFDRQGHCVIDEVPVPTVRDGYLLVKVAYSVISPGTETAGLAEGQPGSGSTVTKVMEKIRHDGLGPTLEVIKDKLSRLAPKGYSGAGTVVAKGSDITEFAVGDRVSYAGEPHAEYVLVPKNLACQVPENVDLKEAAFTTLGSIALHAVRLAEVQLADNVVVVGLGLIGQLAVSLLAAAGANTIGIDYIKERVALAQGLGLRHGIVATETSDIVKEVMSQTNGLGADAALLCAATQSSDPANQAFGYVRRKARVVMVGAMGLNFKRPDLYAKEIDFKISCSYGPGRYDKNYELKGLDYPVDYVRWTENRNMQAFLQMLAQKKLDLRALISREINFGSETAEAYRLLLEEQKNNIGMLLCYDRSVSGDKGITDRKVILKSAAARQGRIGVGVVGAGGFSRGVLIPNVKRLPGVELIALADVNGVEAKQVGRLNGFNYVATDYQELLRDGAIDVIMVATRHNTHYQIARQALAAGKHVHVEKPLTMNLTEALELRTAVAAGRRLLHVGYNRRHAPFVKKVKHLFAARKSPLMVLCRVNVGSLPPAHWVNDPVEGGGRLIGEA